MIFIFCPHKIRRWFLYATAGLLSTSVLLSCSGTRSASNPENIPAVVETRPDVSSSETTDEQVVRFGILAIDSAISVHDRYGPLLDYLSETTGRPFELIALNQESQFAQVAENELDFVASNPLAAVQIERLHNTNFIATLERPKTGSQFSALIIVRSDSDIQTLEDLKGKRAACVDFETAAAGCLFQVNHLIENGIDPFKEFSSFVENSSQDSIVLAVLNRTIDVGFIRTGQLERMIAAGLIDNTDEIRILSPVDDGFFLKHTTALYPEWPIAALAETDPALVKEVQKALLDIPDDHPALDAANLVGFVPSTSYEPMHDLIKNLRLKSWDAE